MVVGSDVRYIGCYTEMADDNDLDGYKETFTGTNTIGKCITTCKMKGKLFSLAKALKNVSKPIFFWSVAQMLDGVHHICASSLDVELYIFHVCQTCSNL